MRRKLFICMIMLLFILIITATKSYGFTIVIDPGHGGSDSGAIADNGTYERDLNLKIAKYLRDYFSDYNMTVYLTHEGFSGKRYELIDRALYARSKNPDLCISIHLNSYDNNPYNGAEVWVSANTSLDKYNKQTTILGNRILNNLEKIGIKNNGVKTRFRSDPTDVYSDGTRADYYGMICYPMRGCKIDNGVVVYPQGATPANIQNGEGVPSILVEHCYIRGTDYQFLNSDEKLRKLAMADGQAIVEHYNLKLKNETPFKDIDASMWYYNAVKYVYENNIIKGYNTTTFAPNDNVTRGMVVTILYRMENEPNMEGTTIFPDVNDNSKYYYKAVKWAFENGVISGYDNGNFGPEDNVTREQLAVILNKYAKYKNKDVSATSNLEGFKDINNISSWAIDQVKWAVGAGVITGNADKTINPTGNATRAEVAAMMQKYCQKVGR